MEELPKNTQNIYKEENKIEKSQTKEGVDFVFEQHPELAALGTKEQYSKYLDTIFLGSKVRDVVYHGTNAENIDKFKTSRGSYGTGIYFQTNHGEYHTGTFGKNVIPAVLNTKNPYIFYSNFKGTTGDLPKLWVDLREQHRKSNTLEELADHFSSEIRKLGYDSLIKQTIDTSVVSKNEFDHLVFEPEQIHILGSKPDIEGFKEFTSK